MTDSIADAPTTIWRRRMIALCWSLGLSALAVIVLVAWVDIDFGLVTSMASRLTPSLAAGLVLLFCGIQMFRVWRLHVLLPRSLPLLDLLASVLVHQFLASLLPWKLGELSLPMLLRRHGIRVGESLAVLVLSRVMDLAAVTLFLSFGLAVFWTSLPSGLRQTWPLAVVLTAAVLTFMALGFAARLRWSGRELRDKSDAATDSRGFMRQLRNGFGGMDRDRIVRGASHTLGMWASALFFNLWFCLAFAPRLAPGAAVVVVLIIPLVNQLPIRGLAGIGTTEAVAVVMFSGAGLSATEALALGVWGHVFHFGLISVGGLLGLGIRWARSRGGVLVETAIGVTQEAS